MTDDVSTRLRAMCRAMDEAQGALTVELVQARRERRAAQPVPVEMLPDLDREAPAPQPATRHGRWAAAAVAAVVAVGIVAAVVTDGPVRDDVEVAPASPMIDPARAAFSADPVSHHRWFRVFPVDARLRGSRMTGVAVGDAGFVALGVVEASEPIADDAGADAADDNVVWTSTDGVTWFQDQEVGGDVFDGATMRDVTGGGPGFVAVGHRDGSAVVWTSTDGRRWSPVPDDPATFADAAMLAVTVGGPGLVAVGSDEPPGSTDDAVSAVVWTSPDGLAWSRLPHDEATFGGSGAQVAFDVTAGGPGLVAVGGDVHDAAGADPWLGDRTRTGVVWTSSDGVNWSRAASVSAPDGAGGSGWLIRVAAGGPGLVAIGTDPGAWASTDGSTWEKVPPPGSDHNHAGSLFSDIGDVAAGADDMVTVGARVHRSVDGRFWSRVRHHPVFTRGTMTGVVAGGPGFVAVGFAKDELILGDPFAAVWVAVPAE